MMNNFEKSVRVILADHHTLVRAGIRVLLEKLPAVEVVGEAGDGREVLDLVRLHRPDVVFMAIALPGLNGLDGQFRILSSAQEWLTHVPNDPDAYLWLARGYYLAPSDFTKAAEN